MKTITFAEMEEQLSAVLDLLRSGQCVTVTQPGKPDMFVAGVGLKPVPDNASMTFYEALRFTEKQYGHIIEEVGNYEKK